MSNRIAGRANLTPGPRLVLAFVLTLTSCVERQSGSAESPDPATVKASLESGRLEPGPDSGIVVGSLHLSVGATSAPVTDTILYLAKTIEGPDGQEAVAAMDRVSSPKAVTNARGEFVFRDVPPGRYALVLDVVVNSYMLLEPGEDAPVLLQVSDGEVLDLGALVYDQLPLLAP